MMTVKYRLIDRQFISILTLSLTLSFIFSPMIALAQGTRITPPKNGYTVEQDVELGQQVAAQVRQQMPIFPENSEATRYVESVGRRLVAAAPTQFRQPSFRYKFDVVNARDINAFALPGGPMFVNRGMIEAAANEGEMAGVMAHELSHVLLRHGTAQATKQQSAKAQLPALLGAIGGAIIGGNLGGMVAQGAQLGSAAYLLRFSREYETQADVLGAQIMSRAGYDPEDLANMFRTIEESSRGGGGPEWLSSHPNPGNRYERITQEANLIGSDRGRGNYNTAEFSRVRSSLRGMAQAPTSAEIEQGRARNPQSGGRQYPNDSRIEQSVESPSSSYRSYTGANIFRISVPSNWQQFEDQSSVTFAPRGAYGNYQGQPVFTHGAIAGVANVRANNLEQASEQYVGSLLQSNSYLQAQNRFQRTTISGRRGLAISLAGRSPVTGRNEVVNVYTTTTGNGQLFYLINVAPNNDFSSYSRVFSNIVQSIRLN